MEVLIIIAAIVFALFVVTIFRGAPYVPTHPSSLNVLFDDLLEISDADLVIDIGSGDGSVLRAAAKRGVTALGYEINPVLVCVSKLLSLKYGRRVQIKIADFWLVKFPAQTTIVYTFGESRDIKKMYEKVRSEAVRLQKDLRFVSYGFEVPNVKPIVRSNAMNVYRITPLQQK